MRPVRFLPALAPLAFLCACGSSGDTGTETATDAAVTTAPAQTAQPTVATDAASETASTTEAATEPGPSPTQKPVTDTKPEAAAAPVAPPVAFAQCRSCHAIEPGKNGIGPSLAGIVGSKAGEVPGYNFSGPLKASGITWNRATLDQWLQGPMKMVPGTKMVISLPNPEARKSVIDYLETLK